MAGQAGAEEVRLVLVLDGGGERVLVFLPGFMTAAESYVEVLTPVADAGVTVLVPQLYRRGVGALAGRVPVSSEASAAADLVRVTAAERGTPLVHLGGHSRGGQAAWRAAALLAAEGLPAGLVVIDPVDGAGRRPTEADATAEPAAFDVRTLVIGAGLGGRCAPEAVNHAVFAAAAPFAQHVLVTGMGHVDLLDDRPRALARRLCPGGPDPDSARTSVSALLVAFLAGTPLPALDGAVEVLQA
ncbi:poly(ethylene terephthalate) hydrolase family protein [Longivirga aurantiaca]|uniref:Alpha/beta hydrolase n=1 Tax=Longivirga aurantiaca TaxID=1837743 RepID=A0ABW1T1G3_9ACTN